MTGDDYIAFAKNLQDQLTCINTAHNATLSVTQDNVEKSPTTKSYKFTKPTYGNKRKTISLDDLNQSSHSPKERRNENLKKNPRPKKLGESYQASLQAHLYLPISFRYGECKEMAIVSFGPSSVQYERKMINIKLYAYVVFNTLSIIGNDLKTL
jgi:hypothetical protein